MANILQVTPPDISSSQRIPGPQDGAKQAESLAVRNPADPSQVVRADGQEAGKTQDGSQESGAGTIRYESNYGAFVKELSGNRQASELLKQILFQMPPVQTAMGREGQISLPGQETGNKEEIVQLLFHQAASEKIFSGGFFDGLRRFLGNSQGQAGQDMAFDFLKAYGDYVSASHLLRQMNTIAKDMEFLMLRQFRGEWKELAGEVDWSAARGQTEANSEALNGRLIPFLASYISRTHDYGPVRNAAMLFIMYAVSYENGSMEHVRNAFFRLARLMERQGEIQDNPQEVLERLLGQPEKLEENGSLAEKLTETAAKGLDRGIGGEDQAQALLKGLLNNESVYMPLLHLVFPFSFEKKQVASELWINPDAPKEEGEDGRKIKVMVNFEIQKLGSFQVVLTIRDRQADLSITLPEGILEPAKRIEADLEQILRENGFRARAVSARKGIPSQNQMEIFPEIR